MTTHSWDVIIAGGGPAGLSAALMLGRSRRRVLVVDAGSVRNRFAAHMHGVLGHEGAAPRDLTALGRAEAAGYGVDFVVGSVSDVRREEGGLQVTAADGAVWATRTLIVATGLSDDLPDIPGLAERWGETVLHCPYCHGWEVRDRRLGVLTTSPLGLHQAQLVRQLSDRVTVFTAAAGPIDPGVAEGFAARGIRLEPQPVTAIAGEGTAIAAVRLADGREAAVDALFTAGAPRPHDDLVAGLALARRDTPLGSFLAVDPTGRTSDDRIWAVGNVVDPTANVPMSIGAGAFAGGAVNGALVGWDVDAAVRDAGAGDRRAPADFWEERYAGAGRVWSGKVNAVLADVADGLSPGRALDLGCGEGADVIWLAQRGWEATGIDISPTAVGRARAAAERASLAEDRARFITADLAELPPGLFDLVTASFLHSPVELARGEILRRAADRVAPGGHLLITSHAAAPPWAGPTDGHEHRFPTPAEQLADLNPDPGAWEVITAEVRPRDAVAPDGTPATLDDAVLLMRRR